MPPAASPHRPMPSSIGAAVPLWARLTSEPTAAPSPKRVAPEKAEAVPAIRGKWAMNPAMEFPRTTPAMPR